MTVAIVGVGLIAAFVVVGVYERRRNDRALARIPLRINVNGIRGKSTVTRLITSILAEAGYNVVGKTTGTAARMIYGHDREEAIVRKTEGANIKEQVACIGKAAEYGANAMVCECMAVRPEYQVVVHEQMLQANICVIVNILEDHLDVMGPTKLQIAEAFSKSIPYCGYCVTVPGPYLHVLEEECRKRASQLIVVDEREVPDELIARFSYEIFPANIALAFGVAQVLGIPLEVAERGALAAKPDPGAAQIVKAKDNEFVFVNGFAANEPSSTWAIWDRIEQKGVTRNGVVVLFNGRLDRVDRTKQFVRDFFPYLPENTVLFCMGQGLSCVTKAYKTGAFPRVAEYRCFEGSSVSRVLEALCDERFAGWCVYGIGNIHGEGGAVISAFEFGFASVIEQQANPVLQFAERHLLPALARKREQAVIGSAGTGAGAQTQMRAQMRAALSGEGTRALRPDDSTGAAALNCALFSDNCAGESAVRQRVAQRPTRQRARQRAQRVEQHPVRRRTRRPSQARPRRAGQELFPRRASQERSTAELADFTELTEVMS